MVYGYVRVSTKTQARDGNSIEDQTARIREKYPEAKIVAESMSGAAIRPEFIKLMASLKAGDRLAVTKLDRFCRTAKEGLEYLDGLMAKGVEIEIFNYGLFNDTPTGKLLITTLLAFAEFERSLIIERTSAGKAIARSNPDYREGRTPSYTPAQIDHAIELKNTHSYSQVEQMTGISKSTLQRAMKKKGTYET
ncbi:MAG: recombinase family protein [Oscillospiraceae bacterium]|nr:recombinase family protein [Oscillospiraceae bacterium]